MVLTVMPDASQQFLAVARGVEGVGARADRADARAAQPADHAADLHEFAQVLGGTRRDRRSDRVIAR